MNRLLNPITLAIIALLLLFLSSFVFTVHEKQTGIKVRLGEMVEQTYGPGLHVKFPVADSVYLFDARILTLDVKPERMLTAEKKNVIVDFFIKWRIANPQEFYKRIGAVESRADSRLTQLGNDAVRNAFRKRTINQVVSSARSKLMDEIRIQLDLPAEGLGIEIVDVRIKKVELPEDVRDSVYERMKKERAKIAREIRSEGEESSKRIRATANRIREETLAEAYAEAEQTRGAGDGESARIYAEAFTQDPEFYSLYRSLSAYRQAFSGQNNVLMLQPNSEFFRYFRNPTPGAIQ
jgi:membrane protease subunit HflC